MKLAVVSLGCAKNLVDTEVMMGLLAESGYELTGREEEAEVLVVNTCGFINAAKEESIDTILEVAKYKIAGNCRALVVTGCLAQKYKSDLMAEIPEIDGIMGTGDINRITDVVKTALAGDTPAPIVRPDFLYDHNLPRVQSTPFYTAFVKIAEGCDNRCSYCVIPELRGGYRSRTMESVIEEVRTLADRGVKEINLIAQDTTRYGEDIYGSFKLAELLKRLADIQGIEWFRVLYAYPTHFTDELVEVLASTPKICHYLDIPLQHAHDRILREMNRRGSRQEIVSLVDKLRARIPQIAIRTSFIVGFPGETEEEFLHLLEFVKEVQFDRVGVFTYSREEDTPAGIMPGQVPEEVKEDRRDRLMTVQQEISLEKNRQKIGQILSVLVEGNSSENPELNIGRTEFDAPDIDGNIFFPGPALMSGEIIRVKVTEAMEYDLIGEVIHESGQ